MEGWNVFHRRPAYEDRALSRQGTDLLTSAGPDAQGLYHAERDLLDAADLSPLVLTNHGFPEQFCQGVEAAREHLIHCDKPEAWAVHEPDGDGKLTDITVEFCARWARETGNYSPDWDEHYDSHPAFVREHYGDQLRDEWLSAGNAAQAVSRDRQQYRAVVL